MKTLLMTTMLVSAMAAVPALAQTVDPSTTTQMDGAAGMPGFTPPEGFTQQNTVLTADSLLGANIYGPDGASFGSVHDLVLDVAGVRTGEMPGQSTGDALGNATDTTMTDGVAPVTPGEATAGMAADPAAAPVLPDPAVTGVDTTAGTTAGTTGMDPATGATDPAMTGTGAADTGMATGTGTTAAETPGAGVTAGTTDTASGSGAAAGQITHVIVDVGGFLGIGAHRTALPLSDLQIYANESETRIYLPWTREQVEALPEYDANDPATLGQSTM